MSQNIFYKADGAVPMVLHLTAAFMFAALLLTSITANIAANDQKSGVVGASDGATLQKSLVEPAKRGGTARLSKRSVLTCNVLKLSVQGEVSQHALLIPEAIDFDLNGSTLLLNLRHNSNGVRLSSRSAIRNGTIRVVQSENKGSQANWYSAVSVRAPYDDGGTPDGLGHF